MGGIIKALSDLFGGGSSPKVNPAAAEGTIDDSQLKANEARSALLETAGGQEGSPLQPGQTSNQRQTLLGN